MKKPVIHVYTFCHNEEAIIPYFLRHYEQFADKIYVLDNYSTDRSRELFEKSPKVELSTYGNEDRHNILEKTKLSNTVYKKSLGIADWVMVVDVDEFVYHPDLIGELSQYHKEGYEILKLRGYQMIADNFPTTDGQIYDEIKTGTNDRIFNKPLIFLPSIDVLLEPGSHSAHAEMWSKTMQTDIKLLHYKALGLDYLLGKFKHLKSRLEKIEGDNKGKFSTHWLKTEGELTLDFNNLKNNSTQII